MCATPNHCRRGVWTLVKHEKSLEAKKHVSPGGGGSCIPPGSTIWNSETALYVGVIVGVCHQSSPRSLGWPSLLLDAGNVFVPPMMVEEELIGWGWDELDNDGLNLQSRMSRSHRFLGRDQRQGMRDGGQFIGLMDFVYDQKEQFEHWTLL